MDCLVEHYVTCIEVKVYSFRSYSNCETCTILYSSHEALQQNGNDIIHCIPN